MIEKAVNMHEFKAAVEEGLCRRELLIKFPTLTKSDINSMARREKVKIKRDLTPKFELGSVKGTEEQGEVKETLDFNNTKAHSAADDTEVKPTVESLNN